MFVSSVLVIYVHVRLGDFHVKSNFPEMEPIYLEKIMPHSQKIEAVFRTRVPVDHSGIVWSGLAFIWDSDELTSCQIGLGG